MPTMVDFPTVVKDAVDVFGHGLGNEPARRHFAQYLTGLLVADKTTVSGINRELVITPDQACLTRWLPAVDGDVPALNDHRVAGGQQAPKTRDRPRGVLAMENTLVDHDGKRIEDVGGCWEHATERYVIGHEDVISNDVCPSGAHSPMEWRRCRKQDAWEKGQCKDHTPLGIELSDAASRRGGPGAFPGDGSFTSAKVLHHIHSQRRAYGGALQLNRQVGEEGREQTRQDVARQIPWAAKNPVRVGSRRYWSLSKRMRLPDVQPPVRIVLFWQECDAGEARKALVRNRVLWDVIRMVWGYRHRWTGTETLHRDGKPPLGLGDCQGRSGAGQTRHGYLVSAADSLLRRSLHADDHRRSLSGGESRNPGQVVDWIGAQLTGAHWSVSDMKAVLVYS